MSDLTRNELDRCFTGRLSAQDALDFLTLRFLPEVIERINKISTRKLLALYDGDRVPENERNLTDVRNRVSILIEFLLASVGNEILRDYEICEVFISYVVANRFPDLETRRLDGTRGIRLEVKCIQSIAEEKAASFDALAKDIHPAADFIVVFLWEWNFDRNDVNWDRAPRIVRAFVFHCESLARLRDHRWLHTPPRTVGDGYQGFDLRYAVNCANGVYFKEEGNFGKLFRIWNSNIASVPTHTGIIGVTIRSYLEFRESAVWSGFETLATRILKELGITNCRAIMKDGVRVGIAGNLLGVLLKRQGDGNYCYRFLESDDRINQVIMFTEKYSWVEFRKERRNGQDRLIRNRSGKKPKMLVGSLELEPSLVLMEVDDLLAKNE